MSSEVHGLMALAFSQSSLAFFSLYFRLPTPLEGIRVARGQRRGKVNGRSAGAVEHLVADVLTVDGHGDGLTTQGAFFGTSFEVLQAGRNGELLDDGTGLVVGLHGLIGFEGLGGGGRHGSITSRAPDWMSA